MNDIWWTQIASARRFLEQITEELLLCKSVLLSVPEWLPWSDAMCTELEKNLIASGSGRSLEFIDCPEDDIGRFLLENYCKKEKRVQYRPVERYAHFLARSSDIKMNYLYIWVRGVTQKRLRSWKEFIAEYYSAVPHGMPCASFILETSTAIGIADTRCLVPLSFDQSITPYDSFTFCALAGAETSMPEALRPYLTEVVSTLCRKDIELCAACLTDWKDFFQDPIGRYCVLRNSGLRSNGKPFEGEADEVHLAHSLWEAQLKQLFPIIERYRSDFIRLHFHEIEALLPVSNRLGEDLSMPQDVELGILYYWALHDQLKTSNDEYHTLDFFRKMRNYLAHLNPLKSEDVYQILSYIKTAG